MKLPSLQFYPGDWLKDPAVRSVSLSARGLWVDMLCLMHESVRRGFLQHATGKPITREQLARMTGCSTEEVSHLLQELEDSGVFSRTEHGIIYNRRMVRDEQKRSLCSEAGKRGGGNPTFKGQSKGNGKGEGKQNPNPSSSSSSDSKESGAARAPTIWDVGIPLLTRGDVMTERSARSLLGRLSRDYGNEKVAEAIAKTDARNAANPQEYLVAVLSREQKPRTQAELNRPGRGIIQ